MVCVIVVEACRAKDIFITVDSQKESDVFDVGVKVVAVDVRSRTVLQIMACRTLTERPKKLQSQDNRVIYMVR